MIAKIRRLVRRTQWGSVLTVEIRAHSGQTTWCIRSWKQYHTPNGIRQLNRVVAAGVVDAPATYSIRGHLPVVDHGDAVRWVQRMLHSQYRLHVDGQGLALQPGITWGHYGVVEAPAVWG